MNTVQQVYGTCPMQPGTVWSASDSSVPFTRGEEEFLGKVYAEAGEGGSTNLITILKNTTGSTLTRGQVLRPDLSSAARMFGDALLGNADSARPAGVVCDKYKTGFTVPNGSYFRATLKSRKHKILLQTTSNARVTLAIGDLLVMSADAGAAWGAAALTAAAYRLGFSRVVTTNGTENGSLIDAVIDVNGNP